MTDNATLGILWGRIKGGLTFEDYKKWAYALWESGIENDAIISMACADTLAWDEIEKYFELIFRSLNVVVPSNAIDLLSIVESELLARYKNGSITGVQLVQEGYIIWVRSGYSDKFRVYGDLDEDIAVMDEYFAPIFYEIDKNDVEGSIRNVIFKTKCG